MDVPKAAKAVAGVIAVAVVAGIVMNWVGDYRAASSGRSGTAASAPSAAATSAAGSTEEPAGTTKPTPGTTKPAATNQVLLVKVDGLNFRKKPSDQSKAMRGLSKGERVVVISSEGSWYKVEDSKGVVGYITSNPTYTQQAK